MQCDGCGQTRVDVLNVSVGVTLIEVAANGATTPSCDVRAAVYSLCVECRQSVKLGLIDKIGSYIRGVRRGV